MWAARLPLLLAAALVAALVAAQDLYRCTEQTEGILQGDTEVLHFEVAPYLNQYKTSLPHRFGVIVRGIHVKACGLNTINMSLSKYSLSVERGPGPQWLAIPLVVTRYTTQLHPPTVPPFTPKDPVELPRQQPPSCPDAGD